MSAIEVTRQSLWELLPELWIVVIAAVGMTLSAFVRAPRDRWAGAAFAVLVIALVALLFGSGRETDVYAAPILGDAFSWYARIGLAFSGLLLVALSHNQISDKFAGEYFTALLLTVAGAMIVAASNELVTLFLGLELVSIPTYFLLYLSRRSEAAREAATKYFFLSIFSSALLLFGMAYLYGLAGVSNLKALSYLIAHTPEIVPGPHAQIGLIAVLFVTAGLAFRVAAVPLHFYAPDVYQGAPLALTALLSWIPKAVGFLAMIRVLTAVVGGPGLISKDAVLIAWVIAAATMTLGNCMALIQDNIKRLFAYSSIAHAGYLMVGITAAFTNDPLAPGGQILGNESVLIYLFAYSLMTLGAFAAFLMLSRGEREADQIDELAGLASTHPWTAGGLAVCLLSLAGIPPTLGFLGKLEIFGAALAAGAQASRAVDPTIGPYGFYALAAIAAVNAAIGAYYYVRIIVLMYLRPRRPDAVDFPAGRAIPWPTATVLGVCASLSLLLFFLPNTLISKTRNAGVASITLPDPRITPVANVAKPIDENAMKELRADFQKP